MRQGDKKSTRIKLLVDNTFKDKTLLIQTNCIVKAVEDEKRQNDEKGCQRCVCRRLRLIPGLLMAAKVSRRSASPPVR
jgi:hypothetical protein